MACEQTEKLATAYIGGELAPEDNVRFEHHLLQCGECTAEVASTMVLNRSLRAMRTHFQPSADFAARVLLQAKTQPAQRAAGVERAKKSFNLSWPALAVAAMVLFSVLGALVWRQSQNTQLLAEIADIHAATLASSNPVDIVSTNRHVVKPWFEGKLPFAFNVPELQNTGFSLDGGRLIYLHQQPGAELLLHYGLHRCSIFIFRDGAAFSRALTQVQHGAFHLQTIRQNGLIFFVVGDLDQDALVRVGAVFAAAQ